MLFNIITGVIVGVYSFSKWMFSPEPVIASVYFLGELGGILILLIKLVLGLILLILFNLAHNRHLHPFSLPQDFFI